MLLNDRYKWVSRLNTPISLGNSPIKLLLLKSIHNSSSCIVIPYHSEIGLSLHQFVLLVQLSPLVALYSAINASRTKSMQLCLIVTTCFLSLFLSFTVIVPSLSFCSVFLEIAKLKLYSVNARVGCTC